MQRFIAQGCAGYEPKDGVVVQGCTVNEPKDGVVVQGCTVNEPKDGQRRRGKLFYVSYAAGVNNI